MYLCTVVCAYVDGKQVIEMSIIIIILLYLLFNRRKRVETYTTLPIIRSNNDVLLKEEIETVIEEFEVMVLATDHTYDKVKVHRMVVKN